MRHHTVSSSNKSDHFGVSYNSHARHVLIQVQENGNQARISLTEAEAIFFMEQLAKQISNVHDANEEYNKAQLKQKES